jgi:hypothetical protein
MGYKTTEVEEITSAMVDDMLKNWIKNFEILIKKKRITKECISVVQKGCVIKGKKTFSEMIKVFEDVCDTSTDEGVLIYLNSLIREVEMGADIRRLKNIAILVSAMLKNFIKTDQDVVGTYKIIIKLIYGDEVPSDVEHLMD